MSRPDAKRPMSLAEAAECCGTFRIESAEQTADLYCEDCPLIIEWLEIAKRRERLLQEARAL